MSENYYRITITGDPGSGKSTFAGNVAKRTGFRLITTGNMFRELAAKRGISITELNELAESQEEIDREVDEYVESLNHAEENIILDSRMAWFFIKDAFKVRLAVDAEEAVRRIFNDKETKWREKFPDIETAMDEVLRRRKSEVQRYQSLYGVDISDDSNFDLVINTSDKDPDEVMALFDKAFEDYKSNASSQKPAKAS